MLCRDKPEHRPCRDCGEVKHKMLFTRNHTFADGFDTLCLECNHRRVREYRAKGKRNSQAEAARYYERYPQKCRERSSLRRGRERQATPSWISADDLFVIEECGDLAQRRTEALGVLWHRDHIVPLAGDGVCGLNVPWNVRVVPAKENWRKATKIIEGL